MRYFVVTDGAASGPFTLDELREAARDGRIAPGTLLRPEDGGDDVLWEQLDEAAGLQASDEPPRRRRRRKATSRTATDDEGPPSVVVQTDPGSFVQGVVMGFVCGIFGLLMLATKPGPDTRRGIYWGFGINLALSLIGLTLRR